MSHVATIDLLVTDLDALKAACERLGLEFVEGQITYKWYGRHVGDYSLPEGFSAKDLGKCAHAIVIPNNKRAYEIGVVVRRDGKEGYQLMWDFWAGGYGLEAIVGKNCQKVRQEYAAEVATREMESQGYMVEREENEDGEIELNCYNYEMN